MATRSRRSQDRRGPWDALPTLHIRPGLRAALDPLISNVLEQPVQRGHIMDGISTLDDDAFEAVSSLVSSLRSLRKAVQRRSQAASYDLGCVAGMLAVLEIARRLRERFPWREQILESMNRVKVHTEHKAKKARSAKARLGGKKRQDQRRAITAKLHARLIKDARDLRRRLVMDAPGNPAPSAWDLAGRLAEIESKPELSGLKHRTIYNIIRPGIDRLASLPGQ